MSGNKRFWFLAAACAAANAGIHAYLAPMHLDEEPYIGVLFIVGTVLLVISVAGLLWTRTRRTAWQLGLAVSIGMCVSYVVSRTIGLPYGYHESWSDPFGTACLLLEAAYVLAYMMAYVRPVGSNDVAVRPDSSRGSVTVVATRHPTGAAQIGLGTTSPTRRTSR